MRENTICEHSSLTIFTGIHATYDKTEEDFITSLLCISRDLKMVFVLRRKTYLIQKIANLFGVPSCITTYIPNLPLCVNFTEGNYIPFGDLFLSFPSEQLQCEMCILRTQVS